MLPVLNLQRADLGRSDFDWRVADQLVAYDDAVLKYGLINPMCVPVFCGNLVRLAVRPRRGATVLGDSGRNGIKTI